MFFWTIDFMWWNNENISINMLSKKRPLTKPTCCRYFAQSWPTHFTCHFLIFELKDSKDDSFILIVSETLLFRYYMRYGFSSISV